MSNDKYIKAECNKLFEYYGFVVKEVPTKNTQTPDLFMYHNDRLEEKYLLEIKTKEDDPSFLEKREKELQSGLIFKDYKILVANNTISGKSRKAANQLSIGTSTFKMIYNVHICCNPTFYLL